MSSDTESYSETERHPQVEAAPAVIPPELVGAWGPIRLYREAHLEDQIQCAFWCIKVGLLRPQPECRRHRRARQLASRPERCALIWTCSGCRDRVSATEGSVFFGAHLSLGRVLILAMCFAHGSSYEDTRRACIFSGEEGLLSNRTISGYFDILRDRLVDTASSYYGSGLKIGGPGAVVQVDEALIGRRKYNRGRVVQGTWVLGMITEDGHVRMEVCERRDGQTLKQIIQKHVAPGSIIHTDGWRAYQGLESLGYGHQVVNHSREFVADDGTHTQRIESQWRALRRRFSPGGVRHEDIGHHLCEYLWRRRCKQDGQDPFVALVILLRAE